MLQHYDQAPTLIRMLLVGGGVAERAVSEGLDFVFLGPVLARSAHPGVVVQQWLACCHTHGELCITAGTSGSPGRVQGSDTIVNCLLLMVSGAMWNTA